MIKAFSIKKLIILVAILALPGFLYYLLQAKGKNRYKPLPIYGPKLVLGTFHKVRGNNIPDTLYHTIKPISFINQDSATVAFADLKRQIIIVNFFYTRNQNLNSILNKRIKSLYDEYKDNKMIRFASITIDSEFDKPNVLNQYAKDLKVNTKKWFFLKGDSTQVFDLAKNEFYVNAHKVKSGDFIVSEKLILLDAEHRIRGYYDGTSVSAILQLSDEIKVQITEELRKIRSEN
jgi:protein SCO1/2